MSKFHQAILQLPVDEIFRRQYRIEDWSIDEAYLRMKFRRRFQVKMRL